MSSTTPALLSFKSIRAVNVEDVFNVDDAEDNETDDCYIRFNGVDNMEDLEALIKDASVEYTKVIARELKSCTDTLENEKSENRFVIW